MSKSPRLPLPTSMSQPIDELIHLVRGRRVLFDVDLAALYEVPTKTLNQALKPNQRRFPEDFALRLSKDELEEWRSQIVTSNPSARMGLRRLVRTIVVKSQYEPSRASVTRHQPGVVPARVPARRDP